MRICIVTESFLPQVNGVTNSVLRILEHLESEGHRALVVAPSGSIEQYRGFPVIQMPSLHLRKFGDIRVAMPVTRVMKQIFEFKPDVIHLASPALMGYLVARRANNLNIPTIGVFQTDLAGFAKHYGLGLTKNAIWSWISKIHRSVDRTLAPSNRSCEDLERISVRQIYLWQRGVNTFQFNPEKRELNSYPRAKRVVGYVGRLASEKRVIDLKPLASRSDIELVIVGHGPAESELRRAIPEARFTGFLSGEELARTLANFDVFIHTGPNETFCQAVQEALSSGVPAIAANQGGPRDLIKHGVNGYLIDTSNPNELNSAVTKLLHPSNWANFAENARKSVEHRSWKSVMDELMQHYQEAINIRKIAEEQIA